MKVQRGFTVIELMVAIAIIGILAALAMGSFRGAEKWRMQGAANDVGQALMVARIEAIKNNRPTLVTFDGVGGVGGVGSQVQVFIDDNRDGIPDPATDTLIKTYALSDAHKGSFISSVEDCNGAVALITFSALGRIAGVNFLGDPGLMPVMVTIDHPTSTTPETYQAVVTRTGVSTVSHDYDHAAACATTSGGSGPGATGGPGGGNPHQ